jgi:hypothetical protein
VPKRRHHHDKSRVTWSRSEAGPPRWEAGN